MFVPAVNNIWGDVIDNFVSTLTINNKNLIDADIIADRFKIPQDVG